MSLSKPRATGLRNPSTKFIKWKGGDEQGWFEYYDKSILDEKLRNVKVDLGKGFVVLDRDLFSITGYDDIQKVTYVSNEVRAIQDHIIVKGYKDKKSSIAMQGTYEKLRDQVRESRIFKYTKSIYIFFGGELCHLSLSGAPFKAWIDGVESKGNCDGSFVHVTGVLEGKRGNVKYKYPVFSVGKQIDKKTLDAAIKCDSEILQPYLEQCLGKDLTKQQETQKEIDTTNWRNVPCQTGELLGTLPMKRIQEIDYALAEAGETDSELYQYIGQAIYDYQQVQKNIASQKDKTGRPITSYTLEELRAIKVDPMSKSYLVLQAAIEEIESKSPEFDDNTDIPF